MRDLTQDDITQAVIARLADTPEPRLRDILTCLVRHLHDFARETGLTEQEWRTGIDFLTRVGHITDAKRQEFILLSDTLGLSTLNVAMNQAKPPGCTEATVFGPFYVDDAPSFDCGADIANGAPGRTCRVCGTVRGDDGRPVEDAEVHVWQADADGKYDVQYGGLDTARARGVLRSGAGGTYHFRSVLAEPYPIPDDGPVGDMLRATARHPWRPAHLHFMISAPGHETLTTHIFRRDDPYLDSDAVFGVRESLIADWKPMDDGTFLVEYDFVLAVSRPDRRRSIPAGS